ncbi:MAG: hypothetical protein R2713_02325 [Ilumatobacteraceae bacterium]
MFEVYFSLRGPEYKLKEGDETDLDEMARDAGADAPGRLEGPGRQVDGLAHARRSPQMLMQALLNGDQALMRALARQAVQRFAGMEPGRPVGGTYYLYRTLRGTSISTACSEKLMDQSRQDVGGELTRSKGRLRAATGGDRIEQFKKEIESEIRRRLVADRGAEGDGQDPAQPPEDVEFMHASRRDAEPEEGALGPLTRKTRRPPGPQAPSRAQGPARLPQHGAPLARITAGCRPSRSSSTASGQAELIVVADISGSVAAFARFTLMLVMRDPEPVLEGALVRVHRRHRRDDRVLPHHGKTSARPCIV